MRAVQPGSARKAPAKHKQAGGLNHHKLLIIDKKKKMGSVEPKWPGNASRCVFFNADSDDYRCVSNASVNTVFAPELKWLS